MTDTHGRYSLNYKGLPYRTEWLELRDIPVVSIKYGAAPTSTKEDGSPYYTLPMIYDPATRTAIADSLAIARYLDETYPDKPTLFPHGTVGLQHAFVEEFFRKVVFPAFSIVAEGCYGVMSERTAVYFRETRERMFGSKLEEIAAKGEAREASLEKLRGAFEVFVGRLDESGKKTTYLLGDTPCYADFVVGANLQWLRALLGEESDLWRMTASVADGRLMKYLEDLRQYEGDWRV